MNCRTWDAACEAYLAGSLDPGRLRMFLAHADACPRCREILDAMDVDLADLVADGDPGVDHPDLVESVLDRTTGSSCERAESLLALSPESTPDADQAALLAAHLEHCDRCAGLERTLSWLLPELKEMGRIEPETDLVYDVLRASSSVRSRKRAGALARRRDRLQLWWEQQVARPRFAWEVAFAASVILALVFGTPLSPARNAPSQALDVVQAGPGRLLESTSRVVEHVNRGVESFKDDFDSRYSRTGPDRADIKRHGREVGSSLLSADLKGAAEGVGSIGRDMGALWKKWNESQNEIPIGDDDEQPSEQ